MSSLGMGGRDERGLELAARQIDAAREHLPEEAGEEPGVAAPGVVVVVHRAVVEKEGEHAADALDDVRDPGIAWRRGRALRPGGPRALSSRS